MKINDLFENRQVAPGAWMGRKPGTARPKIGTSIERGRALNAQCQMLNALTPLFAVIELERPDPGLPVEAAGDRVILLRVPEGAVVGRIDDHRAVVSPPFVRIHL